MLKRDCHRCHEHDLVGGRWSASVFDDKAPYRGKSGSDRQSPIPASEALAGALSGWFQLGQQDCLDIGRSHNAPHNLWPKVDWRCGKQFIR
jgi:hypothetical protein